MAERFRWNGFYLFGKGKIAVLLVFSYIIPPEDGLSKLGLAQLKFEPGLASSQIV
jgi:hypothetical protein